jgi:hypothetical protein
MRFPYWKSENILLFNNLHKVPNEPKLIIYDHVQVMKGRLTRSSDSGGKLDSHNSLFWSL